MTTDFSKKIWEEFAAKYVSDDVATHSPTKEDLLPGRSKIVAPYSFRILWAQSMKLTDQLLPWKIIMLQHRSYQILQGYQ